MSDSLGEIRTALAHVAEQLDTAYRHAGQARTGIGDAVAVLTALDEQHPEPLVPPQLRRAGVELDRGLTLIASGLTAVADIDARL